MAGVHQYQSPAHDRAAEGHHDMIAQPHSEEEGPVAEAEILAATLLAGGASRVSQTAAKMHVNLAFKHPTTNGIGPPPRGSGWRGRMRTTAGESVPVAAATDWTAHSA